jgi:hypothetical protein
VSGFSRTLSVTALSSEAQRSRENVNLQKRENVNLQKA